VTFALRALIDRGLGRWAPALFARYARSSTGAGRAGEGLRDS